MNFSVTIFNRWPAGAIGCGTEAKHTVFDGKTGQNTLLNRHIRENVAQHSVHQV